MSNQEEPKKIPAEQAKQFLEYMEQLMKDKKVKHITTLAAKCFAYLDKNFDIDNDEWSNRLMQIFIGGMSHPILLTKEMHRYFLENSDMVVNIKKGPSDILEII